MLALRNPIQRYEWGSEDRLARFLGQPPDGGPQAELWMGAHPSAPSMVHVPEAARHRNRAGDADRPGDVDRPGDGDGAGDADRPGTATRAGDGDGAGDADRADTATGAGDGDTADGGETGGWGDGLWVGLDALIAEDPQRWVGAEVCERFGPRLPFLFKVLAAAEPLSLQLHPDLAAAAAGFAAEEAAGIPLGDPARRYRDPNHKPELLVALDEFEVLSGFRPAAEIAEVFGAFGLPPAWVELAGSTEPGELGARLWQLDLRQAAELVELVVQAAGSTDVDPHRSGLAIEGADWDGGGDGATSLEGVSPKGPPGAARFEAERDFLRRASAGHPGDIGLVVGLCLNRATLQPGDGTFAEPGVLHSYLGGFGLEIMANSDNVLRGGLTTKLVDVEELRRHLVGASTAPRHLRARPHQLSGGVEERFDVLVDEFALSSLRPDPDAGEAIVVASGGPEILLCVQGEVTVTVTEAPERPVAPDWPDLPAVSATPNPPNGPSTSDLSRLAMLLQQGQSAFLPAGHPTYQVSGAGTLFRAQVGIHARRLWAD